MRYAIRPNWLAEYSVLGNSPRAFVTDCTNEVDPSKSLLDTDPLPSRAKQMLAAHSEEKRASSVHPGEVRTEVALSGTVVDWPLIMVRQRTETNMIEYIVEYFNELGFGVDLISQEYFR